jgi:tryptophan synthase alpha chain
MIRTITKLPVVAGFGVSTPEQARRIGCTADGVVVGSAFVKLIGEHAGRAGLIDSVTAYAASLKAALR